MQEPANLEDSKLGKIALRAGLAGLIPLLTAAAYMAGFSYHRAYLSAFGIPGKLITKNTSDYFVHAYMAMSETLFRLISITGLAILGMAVFAIYMWWAVGWLERLLQNNHGVRRVREKVEAHPFLRRIRDALLIPIFAIAVGYMALALLFVLVLPEGLGEYAGRSRAHDDLALFKAGCLSGQSVGRLCNEVFDGDMRIAYGFILDSSENYIAIYEDGSVRTLPVTGKHFVSKLVTE